MECLNQKIGKNFAAYQGDCCEVIKSVPDESVGFSIFSPPFASLYTYSNSERDMGNCASYEEFFLHFAFLVAELFRVTKPGRSVAFHCMNIPAMKERDGYIGLKDFRGDLIRAFQREGFVYHSEHCIWKDPLIEATRTKALGLMHKQLCKDSAICRSGLPDYLIAMRKPGENPEPVAHENGLTEYAGNDEPNARKGEPILKNSLIHRNISMAKQDPVYSHSVWRKYASPVWMDIRQSNTLQYESARDHEDERHICPLQLDVIERGLGLWSNPGDAVLSPFMGIGSEGVVSLRKNRKFIGIELKESYYKQAVANLMKTEEEGEEQNLFNE